MVTGQAPVTLELRNTPMIPGTVCSKKSTAPNSTARRCAARCRAIAELGVHVLLFNNVVWCSVPRYCCKMLRRMRPGMYERVSTAQHAAHTARNSTAQYRTDGGARPHRTARHGPTARQGTAQYSTALLCSTSAAVRC